MLSKEGAAMKSRALVRTSTPGIFKRGNSYVVVFRDPQRRQRKRAARTLAEARTLKAELTADVRRGEFRAQSQITFADYAAEWIGTYRGRTHRGVGDVTRHDYGRALELRLVPFFGRIQLAAIEPRDVRRLVSELEAEGLSPASVGKVLSPLRALLATAVEDGLIRANPASGIRIGRIRAGNDSGNDVVALTEDELSSLLAELPDQWRLFFRFLFETGLRFSEAIEARFSDIDGSWLNVDRRFYRGSVGPPKGRKRRRIRLGDEMGRALWRLRSDRRAGAGDLIFTAERGGRIRHSNLMGRVLKPAAVRAGLGRWVGQPLRAETWVGFHTFRHTCATMLFLGRRNPETAEYEGGWNVAQVQRFLGHTDPGFTLRTYVHLLPEDLPDTSFLGEIGAGGNTKATAPADSDRRQVPAAVVAGGQ
jgi:integrase